MDTPATLGQLWIWPVLVCLAAWLFRRWVLRKELFPAGRRGHRGWGWVVSAQTASSPVTGNPAGLVWWKPEGLLRRMSGTFAGLWPRSGSRAAATDLIEVLGRRIIGPQQQLLVVRAGAAEYALLLQGGGQALLLSTRAVQSSGSPGRRRNHRRRPAIASLPKTASGRRDLP